MQLEDSTPVLVVRKEGFKCRWNKGDYGFLWNSYGTKNVLIESKGKYNFLKLAVRIRC